MLRVVMPFVLSLLLVDCASRPANDVSIITSPNDTSRYEYLVLPNGLKVVLVSDPKAPKSAASLDVFVGSAHEPANRPGLAHFLEHMLFLGTEKYPDADAYQAFITAHGGMNNAYTSYEHTNYFFNIEHASFAEGLDRFAQFFIAPKMDAAYVDREKHAVDSEYHARIRDEQRRSLDVLSEVGNPAHPLNRFSIGSLETLADHDGQSIRDDLLAFYHRYYVAPDMGLVVVSNKPLKELRALVRKDFAAVPSHPVARTLPDEPLFKPGSLPMRVDMVPDQELRELSLVFPVPEVLEHYRTKPLDYIANILGHEGEGSLLAYLKAKGWVDSLSAGATFNFSDVEALSVDMSLTREGLRHVDDVVQAFFQAVVRLREDGMQAWRYNEQATVSELHFRYLEKTNPDEFATQLASNLHHYPAAEVLHGDYVMEGFPPALVKEYLGYLVPDNLLMMVTDKSVQPTRTSRWFHVPYRVQALSPATVARWQSPGMNPAIRLPDANTYLPEHFGLVGKSRDAKPQRMASVPGLEAWFLPDSRFGVPRGNADVALYNPAMAQTAHDMVLRSLYTDLLGDRLRQTLYPAWLAGMGFTLAPDRQGIQLSVTGFNDKQSLVMDQLANAVRQVDMDAAAFERIKDARIRAWINSNRTMPFRRLVNGVAETLDNRQWSGDVLAEAAKAVTFADVQAYGRAFLSGVSAQMLLYGNYTDAQAQALLSAVTPLVTASNPRPPVSLRMPAAGAHELVAMPVQHNDAALLWYAAGDEISIRQMALFALTGQVLESSFFNDLRTEQQLGYVVYAGAYPLLHETGMMFVVQSPTHDVPAILSAVQAYIKPAIDTMDPSLFDTSRRALMGQFREPATNLQEMSDRLWADLVRYRMDGFDRREQLARALGSITLADWQAFARDTLLGPQSRNLLLYAPGKAGVDKAVLVRQWGDSAPDTSAVLTLP